MSKIFIKSFFSDLFRWIFKLQLQHRQYVFVSSEYNVAQGVWCFSNDLFDKIIYYRYYSMCVPFCKFCPFLLEWHFLTTCFKIVVKQIGTSPQDSNFQIWSDLIGINQIYSDKFWLEKLKSLVILDWNLFFSLVLT